MILIRIKILVLAFLFVQIELSAQLYEYFEPKVYHSAQGDSLLYRMMDPANLDKQTSYPLIVFLHGAGERGQDNRAQLTHVLSRFVNRDMRLKYPCFIIAPQCPKEIGWGDGSWTGDIETGGYQLASAPSVREKMILELIEQALRSLPVDPKRIYIAGLSMGGAGTWSMISHYPNQFAAAVPICGAGDIAAAAKLVDVPIWVFHGSDDPIVSPAYSRTMVKAINAAGGRAILTEFEGVKHNSWEKSFDENPFIYDWLFSQRRKK